MNVFFTASKSSLAQKALTALIARYGQSDARLADAIVALGGDGHALHTLHEAMDKGKPVFAMRRTESIGFLCNSYAEEGLEKRLAQARKVTLHPLRLEAVTGDDVHVTSFAINEISVLRETPQAAKLRLMIDGVERIAKFSGDGLLLATPAGSTAYNHSCGGPILPLTANTLVMTGISGYRPRGWSYAVLPQTAVIEIEALETDKRPVRIESGGTIIRNVVKAKMHLDCVSHIDLMFDPEEHLGERILREQFMTAN